MKNPKIYRLALGLIILFSIFLFQGSEDQSECTQCDLHDKNNDGYLEIINKMSGAIYVRIEPSGSQSNGYIGVGGVWHCFLNPGTYFVSALEYTYGDIFDVKWVTVKKNSSQTIIFDKWFYNGATK